VVCFDQDACKLPTPVAPKANGTIRNAELIYLCAMHDPEENPWKITAEKKIYDNPWINLTEYQVINPSGNPGIYGKVRYKNLAIGVVPLDDELNIYLVGQYRFALNQYSWELPEGGGHIGTDPLESAKRELLEETGLKAGEWTELQRMHLSNSVTDELSITYLARGLEQFEPEPEETEQLQIRKVSLDEAYRMIGQNEITDAITVAAVLKVKLLLLENRLS
jgi:ADP-ribose pyrophosphatase